VVGVEHGDSSQCCERIEEGSKQVVVAFVSSGRQNEKVVVEGD
jgi:hypothetical protein